MKRALIVVALVAFTLAAGLPLLALAQGGPVFITETPLPSSERQKFPHVDTLDSTVLVAGNAERSFARLWSKADTAATFGAPLLLGAAEGTPDYTTASVFVSPDGVTYVAWINERERRIYLRAKARAAADFGGQVLVYGAGIPYEVEVAANEDGVFVFWREVGTPIKYRRSSDGVNWVGLPVGSVGTAGVNPVFDVTAGPNRKLAVAYYRPEGDRLQSYLGIWDGSGFATERIPAALDREFANPSVALRPDGGFNIAMRSVEQDNNLGAGVYVADRSPSGAWSSVARLARGDSLAVSLDIDTFGNTHLVWSSREAGPTDLYYTFRRAGEGYGGSPPAGSAAAPLRVQSGNRLLTNVRVAASLRDRSYGHVVAERFEGDSSFGRYYLFGLPVNVVGAAGVSIEGGAAVTSKATVSVSFSGVTGSPTGVRWSWGAPPGAAVPYGDFNPASPTISVPVPAGASPNCAPLTLYTQLRADGFEQQGANSDSILFDQAVQAEFAVAGPPPALDPGYTSALSATLSVYSGADCAGIAGASVSGPLQDAPLSLPVAGTTLFQRAVALTGDPATPGVKEFVFTASDQLGNSSAPVTRTLIYDPAPPTLRGIAAETPTTLVPHPRGTTRLTLALESLDAVDVGGAVAGIELVVVGPPLAGAPVTSDPVRIPFSRMDQVTANGDGTLSLRETLSLLDFFAPAELAPGSYSFVVRVVDGAGNASAESQTFSEALDRITFVGWAPLVGR